MSKVVTAEYDAENRTLVLAEPLEDVKDHETVVVTVERPASGERRWAELSGILSKEDGEELAKAIEEMFPPWND